MRPSWAAPASKGVPAAWLSTGATTPERPAGPSSTTAPPGVAERSGPAIRATLLAQHNPTSNPYNQYEPQFDQWSIPIGDDKGWIIYGIVNDARLVILLRFLPVLE
jgi:hypothetical protein